MPHLSLRTPVGDLTVFEREDTIVAVEWGWAPNQARTVLLDRAVEQLQAYMDGELQVFDLPVSPQGRPYQQAVWRALQDIPFGRTQSYGQIAARIGGSARSVGQASGCNPIPIIVPCHRVVAKQHLGGYSGGEGLATKRWLLDLENPHLNLLHRDVHGETL